MLAAFFDDIRDGDMIAPKRMAARLRVPMTRLSQIAHVNRNTMANNAGSPAVQAKLGEIARIIAKAAELSGDSGRAIIWFRHQPIAAFGATAEDLVEQGHAGLVIEHLDRMEAGVYS